MAIKRFALDEAINEETDAEYACLFHDAGVDAPALDAAAILTIAATLSNVSTGEVINSREDQNVKNLNGGILASDGTFTLHLTGNVDNVILSDTLAIGKHEQHKLQLAVTYNRGSETGYLNHEVLFYVVNLTLPA